MDPQMQTPHTYQLHLFSNLRNIFTNLENIYTNACVFIYILSFICMSRFCICILCLNIYKCIYMYIYLFLFIQIFMRQIYLHTTATVNFGARDTYFLLGNGWTCVQGGTVAQSETSSRCDVPPTPVPCSETHPYCLWKSYGLIISSVRYVSPVKSLPTKEICRQFMNEDDDCLVWCIFMSN